MIRSITLKYFRRHTDLHIDLTEGLQTFRGANEAGKTTILEGAACALFGSKALRNSMAETVTWNHKESELFASVQLEINGQTYTFKRSKAGAEVYVAGVEQPFVTGQNEVSAFAAELLGCDVNVATHLMLSGQGNLRGVLEQGPKATHTLIETLSDLDLIDRIVEAAAEKLQLGSTAVLEERLVSAQTILDGLTVPEEPVAPNLDASREGLKQAEAELVTLNQNLDKAKAAYDAEEKKRGERYTLMQRRDVLREQSADIALKVEAAKAVAVRPVPDLKGLQAQLADGEAWEARRVAYTRCRKLVKPFLSLPEDRFDAMAQRVRGDLAEAKAAIRLAKAALEVLEPQVATEHTCPACGQDTSHLEHVKAKQAELQEKIKQNRKALAEAEAKMPELEEDVKDLVELENIHKANLQIINQVRDHVDVEEGRMPIFASWRGEAPGADGPDVEAYRQKVIDAERETAEIRRAETQVEVMQGQIQKLSADCEDIMKQVEKLGLASDTEYEAICEAFSAASSKVTIQNGIIAMFKIELETAEAQYRQAYSIWKDAKVKLDTQKQTVSDLKADIERTQFNNALVKKVRAARPIIANKLWNLVLTTVSTLFTQMRGEQSIVAKGKDGFTVNGKPVESLSGSTLDILGLAIRCALIKTFVPNCPFLVLDEPSAACDESRSAALIGFVAAAGFKQVILVTHEGTSEALSSNLIQL